MDDKRYWFPAKRYGWGWGLPTVWQGWVVFLAYFFAIVLTITLIPPKIHPLLFTLVTSAVTVAFIAIVAWKGAPPQWRWGKK